MSNGFYLMHRGWMEHHLFECTKYSEREAWCWLVENASFTPSKMRHNRNIITVSRGQVPTSYRKLAEKWKWGVNRVRGFLDLLERDGMISRKTDTGFLIINLCNYDKFQTTLRNSDTQADTGADTPPDTGADTGADTQADTNINKGIKKGERNKGIFVLPDWIPEKEWNAYVSMRKQIKKALTDDAKKLAVEKLNKLRKTGNDPTAVLNQSIFNNWLGLFEVKNNGNQTSKQNNSPRGASNFNDTGQSTKTERLKAAAMRAAQAGGFAPESEGEAGINDNALSVFPDS